MSGVITPIPSDWSPKDPSDVVWYGISFENTWGEVLSTDSILSITSVTCVPSDLVATAMTIGPGTNGLANQAALFLLSGGSVPATQTSGLYQVTVVISSVNGQTISRSEMLRVQKR